MHATTTTKNAAIRRAQKIDPMLLAVDGGVTEPVNSVAGDNATAMRELMRMYARPGMTVVDPTYGRGVFWSKIDVSSYQLLATDLASTGHDFRSLPHPDGIAHVVVLDPPYRYKPPAGTVKDTVDVCYRLSDSPDIGSTKAVHELYAAGMREAHRILKPYGFLLLKCQDTIEAGKQVWTHVRVMAAAAEIGFVVRDIVVVVNPTPSPTRWSVHHHARKGHSYFLVLRRDRAFAPGAKSTQPRKRK